MHNHVSRRDFARATAASVAGLAALTRRAGAEGAGPATAGRATATLWPFYAFDNGLRTVPTIEGKAKLLKDLGYAGIEYHMNVRQLPRMLEQLDKHGLALNAVYTVPFLEDPVPAGWPEAIKLMKGRPTRIEMAIRSRSLKKPSDPKGDAKAGELMTRVSDLCADTGPVVSVYPHTWFWTERVDDGVRLARRLGRKNVGTNFNLVHWHWVRQPRPLETVLREALPHLFSVTINNGTKKGRKIYALDRGDYDPLGFMTLVKKIGYTGQVGLQCYSVPGPSEAHLSRSMRTWRAILKKLAQGDAGG